MSEYAPNSVEELFLHILLGEAKKEKKMTNATMNASKAVNWTKIVASLGRANVKDFADGNTSGRQLYEYALDIGSKASADVRNLLRDRGVAEARQLARKALARR